MAKISNKQLAVALYQATDGLSDAKSAAIIYNFAVLLCRQHKLKQTKQIIQLFIKHAKTMNGVTEIAISSARALDEKIIEKIKKFFGKNTEATLRISPELLGGIKIKSADKIFDISLATRINQLKKVLY